MGQVGCTKALDAEQEGREGGGVGEREREKERKRMREREEKKSDE